MYYFMHFCVLLLRSLSVHYLPDQIEKPPAETKKNATEIHDYLPITGQELIHTLERALQIEKQLKSKRNRLGPTCGAEASNSLQFLTQNPNYATSDSSQSQSQEVSPVK